MGEQETIVSKRGPGRPPASRKVEDTEIEGQLKYVILVGKAAWSFARFFAFWAATCIAFSAGYVIGILYGLDWLVYVVLVFGVTSFAEWLFFFVIATRAMIPRKMLVKEREQQNVSTASPQ